VLKVAMILSIFCFTAQVSAYEGSYFHEVWGTVTKTPYRTLLQKEVTLASMFDWGINRIQNAAERTLSDRSDILDHFEKLVHPNGICFKGTWEITNKSKYSGHFENGRKGLIIARASAALSETKRGEHRAFGLAGKLYPTLDEQHLTPLKTGNFFLIDDLGGTKADHFSRVELTNQPDISINTSSFTYSAIAAVVAKAFVLVDKKPHLRQVYEVSELGERTDSKVITPYWMKVRGASSNIKSDAVDFRDELEETLLLSNGLKFDILVAEKALTKSRAEWKKIGLINFTESVISRECDHRLHFHHPDFREDLTH
jgi:hypothetical protein